MLKVTERVVYHVFEQVSQQVPVTGVEDHEQRHADAEVMVDVW
jgi:hypothetical protein